MALNPKPVAPRLRAANSPAAATSISMVPGTMALTIECSNGRRGRRLPNLFAFPGRLVVAQRDKILGNVHEFNTLEALGDLSKQSAGMRPRHQSCTADRAFPGDKFLKSDGKSVMVAFGYSSSVP